MLLRDYKIILLQGILHSFDFIGGGVSINKTNLPRDNEISRWILLLEVLDEPPLMSCNTKKNLAKRQKLLSCKFKTLDMHVLENILLKLEVSNQGSEIIIKITAAVITEGHNGGKVDLVSTTI